MIRVVSFRKAAAAGAAGALAWELALRPLLLAVAPLADIVDELGTLVRRVIQSSQESGNIPRRGASNARAAAHQPPPGGDPTMITRLVVLMSAAALLSPGAAAAQAAKLTDPQIAHVAYTAGKIDIAAGQQALKISKDARVRAFAQQMVRDHTAVNDQALALVKKLHVTPQDNPTSQGLQKDADAKLAQYAKLKGHAFDRAYIRNEVAYHKTVNGALETTLIPDAQSPELKSLLQTGMKLFQEHKHHADPLATKGK